MKFKKVRNLGSFGKDYNMDVTTPGLYSIPIPDYDTELGYKWIDVDIRRVIMPPRSRLHCIIGYDENGKSQMWYYNGSQQCFKRIWQDGSMGAEYKTSDNVLEYLVDDVNLTVEAASEVTNFFMSL